MNGNGIGETVQIKRSEPYRKEPEAGRLINYTQVQSKAEYSLSGRGKFRMVVADPLCMWGKENRPEKS